MRSVGSVQCHGWLVPVIEPGFLTEKVKSIVRRPHAACLQQAIFNSRLHFYKVVMDLFVHISVQGDTFVPLQGSHDAFVSCRLDKVQ